ncbi:nucleoside hydrolase-like domain-containing protein [Celerinatantimonas sp. YJH-8]|uniref:DUF1593 domain-containing protein n=1 Tax=Celerinatantimonas sp. YJH-8 TaxID=3228714 RepID=UPI0038CB5679
MKQKRLLWLVVTVLLAGISFPNWASTPEHTDKTRILILTDIGNEPDDSESFVRFLTYSNEFDIEKIIATTSTWQRDAVHPEMLHERVAAYAKVYSNLMKHADGFPTPASLDRKIMSGQPGYGMNYVGKGKTTQASQSIIAAIDKVDARPLWITVWGGSVDLAQALWDIQHTRTVEQIEAFIHKIRVYSISDQDNTGAWIRRNFPTMRWISSLHAYNDYWLSTWVGISSPMVAGGDMSQVNNNWVHQYIQLGVLGQKYPDIMYIMEGDSPSFLYLLHNGLNDPEHPEFGGWGGRYAAIAPDDETGLRVSTSDSVKGIDGKMYRTAPATIWRFRHQFQNDFAGRIQWTLKNNFAEANHNPIVKLNGHEGLKPVNMTVSSGDEVTLSAQGTMDPDRDKLTYRWWQYAEPTAQALEIHFAPTLKLIDETKMVAHFIAPKVVKPTPFHVILEVHDNGQPELYSYRRAIITVQP